MYKRQVYFRGDCSGVKGRKGQHGVGLAVKKEIVKKAGKDGIAIECISARLLKARISIKSTSVTFVVVYTPTGDATEEKAKYMAALNSTVNRCPPGNTSSLWPTRTPERGREEREAGKQTARCWALMAETCSTKTANYYTPFCRRQQTCSSEHLL